MRISDWSSNVCSSDLTVFVYATSPAIQGYVGLWFGRLKRALVVQWIQDLWPEALSATGFVRNRHVLGTVRAAVSAMYRDSDLVLGQSHAFVRHIKRSEEHTSELQSLMRISSAVFCLKNNN